LRLAFVIQRYGEEVNGGAELHCRWLAERLAQRHEVEVFTTCALDYIEWRNHFPAGTTTVGGIPVHRFPVRRRRSMRRFGAISNLVFHETHSRAEEEEWVLENGPDAPALMKAVGRARDRFDRFFFYCYRYYHSYHGIPLVGDKAILVPTAEEDPAISLGILREFFRRPKGFVYLTPEEQALVEDAGASPKTPSVVIGSGLNLPAVDRAFDFAARHGLTRPFILYVGRIDKNKGCVQLFAYFKKFLEETGEDVDLVLAG
jgi:glycosyltransferase involved in cell wall biosynthesis